MPSNQDLNREGTFASVPPRFTRSTRRQQPREANSAYSVVELPMILPFIHTAKVFAFFSLSLSGGERVGVRGNRRDF
jgi:hypothetical protein